MKFSQKVINKAVEVNDKISNRGTRTKPKNPYTASKQTKHAGVKQTVMTSKLAHTSKIESPELCSPVRKGNCLTEYNEPNLVSPDSKGGLEKESAMGASNNTSTRSSESQINYSFTCAFLCIS